MHSLGPHNLPSNLAPPGKACARDLRRNLGGPKSSDKEKRDQGSQHAHPGGLLHLALALMQVFPQGCPFVQCLQQASGLRASWVSNSIGSPGRSTQGE